MPTATQLPTIARIRCDDNEPRLDLIAEQAKRLGAGDELVLRFEAEGVINRYRTQAELYDEVWEAARAMGYANVTMALADLIALKKAQTREN